MKEKGGGKKRGTPISPPCACTFRRHHSDTTNPSQPPDPVPQPSHAWPERAPSLEPADNCPASFASMAEMSCALR